MDTVPNTHASSEARLPLRTAPLIFGLYDANGATENLWGVGIAQGSNAYVYCSSYHPQDPQWHDLMKRSGRRVGYNEVSLAPRVLMSLLPGRRLWLSWPEHHDRDASFACYSIFLPRSFWAVRITDEERIQRARQYPAWREPHALIEGTREQEETVVISLLRLKGDRSVDRIDGRSVSTIGILPLDADFSVHVTVALETVQRRRQIEQQMTDLPTGGEPNGWSEETEPVVFATMGNDEVGYATIVRQPAVVSTRAKIR